MRYVFVLSLIALAPAAVRAQGKKSEEPGPVKVIELKRGIRLRAEVGILE